MRRFVICLVLSSFGGAVHGQSLDNVIRDWSARRAARPTAKYTLVVEHTEYPFNSIVDGKPTLDKEITTSVNEQFLIDFRNGWFRQDSHGTEYVRHTKSYRPLDGSRVFHEGILRSKKNPVVGKTAVGETPGYASDYIEIKGDLRGHAFDEYLYPLFFDSGFIPPLTADKLYPGQFQLVKPEDARDVLTPVAGPTGGKSILRLSCPPERLADNNVFRGEYAVDTSRNSAIVNWTLTKNGKVIQSTDIDYRRTERGWVLDHWVFVARYNGQILRRIKVRVASIEFGPPIDESVYELKPDEGMVVSKVTEVGRNVIPLRESYVVEADGSLKSVDPGRRNWLWISIGAVTVCVLAFYLNRYLRTRRNKPT